MKSKPFSEGHVVMEYDVPGIGAHVVICDDYCRDMTAEELEAWKKRMAVIIAKGYIRDYEKKH